MYCTHVNPHDLSKCPLKSEMYLLYVCITGEKRGTDQVTGRKDATNHLETNQPFVELTLYGVTSASPA